MIQIDPYSYHCGAIDCFNEMIHAGLKRIALSHPAATREERDQLIPFSREICQKYGTHFYLEDEPLLTDLFPISMNKGKWNIIYWRQKEDLDSYLQIKADKQALLASGEYCAEARRQIALRFGQLLSYPEERSLALMAENKELEPIE